MYKFLPSFESKFETPTISDGAREQSALRVNIISNAKQALNSAANLINIDASTADTVPLNSAERFYQPSVNRGFNRIVTQPAVGQEFNRMIEQEGLATSPISVDVVPVPSAEITAQAAVNLAFDQIIANDQATYQQPPVDNTISLTQDHPNQAAINEALLRAMAIHDQNGPAMPEDLRV